MKRVVLSGLSALTALALAACQSNAPPETASYSASQAQLIAAGGAEPLPLLVSYRVLMTGMIGEAGFKLFRYADTEAPPTEKEWTDAGMAATNLVAIATLLSLEGGGKNDKNLHQNANWHEMTRNFQTASAKVATAASKRDLAAFQNSLGALGDSCQSCHARFMDYQPKIMPDLAQLQSGDYNVVTRQ